MNDSLNFLAKDLFLKQSELFSNEYQRSETTQTNTYNELSVKDLTDWLNSISIKYNFLNNLQFENLSKLVNSLNSILQTIDPNKLKINTDIVEDSDLMLWRESDKGLSIITLDDLGQIAFNYTGKNGKKIKGNFDNSVDMEKLLYKFLSM